MSGMDLDGIKSKAIGAAGRRNERFPDATHPGFVERQRRRVPRIEGNGRRPYDGPAAIPGGDQGATLPGNLAGSFASGMRELDGDGDWGISPDGLQHASQGDFIGVRVEAHVAVSNPPLRFDAGRLNDQDARA